MKTHHTAKIVLAMITLGYLGIDVFMSFIEPGHLLLEARTYPSWLPWLGRLIAISAAIGYLVLEVLGTRDMKKNKK